MEVPLSTEICRCCLAPGNYKSLKDTFQWMGQNENYGDMLKECFNVTLCDANDSCHGGICELCITQLRNARNFKKQVLKSDEIFKQGLDNNFKGEEVKIEFLNENDLDSDTGNQDDYFAGLETEEETEVPVKEEITVATKSRKRTVERKAPVKNDAPAKKKKPEGETSGKGLARNITTAVESEDFERIIVKEESLHEEIASDYVQINSTFCAKCRIEFENLVQLMNHLKGVHVASNAPVGKLTLIDSNKTGAPEIIEKSYRKYGKSSDSVENCNATETILTERDKTDISDDVNDERLVARVLRGLKKGKLRIRQKYAEHLTDGDVAYFRHPKVNLTEDCCKIVKSYEVKDEDFSFDGTRYTCNRCKKMFTNKTNLRRHLKNTHDRIGGRIVCPYCDEKFMVIRDFKRHLRSVHDADENLYACGACEKSFSNPKALDHHHRSYHLQEKNFKCDTCDYECYSRHLLLNHMLRHSDERRFICKHCPKTFKRWNEHARHERIHTGYKPYACSVCDKTFAQKASINYHMSKFHPGVNIKVYRLNKLHVQHLPA